MVAQTFAGAASSRISLHIEATAPPRHGWSRFSSDQPPSVSTEVQVGTQVLPPSVEMAQSCRQDFAVMLDQTFRVTTVLRSTCSLPMKVHPPPVNAPPFVGASVPVLLLAKYSPHCCVLRS